MKYYYDSLLSISESETLCDQGLMVSVAIEGVLGLSHVESPRGKAVIAVSFGWASVSLIFFKKICLLSFYEDGLSAYLNLDSADGSIISRSWLVGVVGHSQGIGHWIRHSHGHGQVSQNE